MSKDKEINSWTEPKENKIERQRRKEKTLRRGNRKKRDRIKGIKARRDEIIATWKRLTDAKARLADAQIGKWGMKGWWKDSVMYHQEKLDYLVQTAKKDKIPYRDIIK